MVTGGEEVCFGDLTGHAKTGVWLNELQSQLNYFFQTEGVFFGLDSVFVGGAVIHSWLCYGLCYYHPYSLHAVF